MTGSILVVDDLERNTRLLEAKLLSEYYNVYTANSGQEALSMIKSNKIDVVLLDVMMPGMDGFEVCKIIKSNPETMHIPVVMVTALASDERVRGLESGADEFLSKPINDHELLARVKSLTRLKQTLDELKLRNKTYSELGEKIIDLTEDFEKTSILIIDDDIIQSKNTIKILSRITQKVKSITDVSELNSIEENFDLIILSCQIEDLDPLRLIVSLKSKEIFRYSSVLLLVEEGKNQMLFKAMDLGANDYLHYPIDKNELVARVKTQLRRKKYQDELRNNLEQSVNLSIKDSLTNLFNRRYFDIHINNLMKKSEKTDNLISIILIDIDHFKETNDNYGHKIGDLVLQKFSKILVEKLRITDIAARYGGEEFIISISNTSEKSVLAIAERIRKIVEKTDFEASSSKKINVTISLGVSFWDGIISPERLIEKADSALYKAKKLGRNMVVLSE